MKKFIFFIITCSYFNRKIYFSDNTKKNHNNSFFETNEKIRLHINFQNLQNKPLHQGPTHILNFLTKEIAKKEKFNAEINSAAKISIDEKALEEASLNPEKKC